MNKPFPEPDLGAVAPKPLAHHEFRPDINGLRALAVLSVLGFHAGFPFTPGGFAGVDIFFVISGFLISRIILSERQAGAFSLADFYGKRVKRILPALLLVVFASWAAGWAWLDPDAFRRTGGHMEASSYFSVNLWLYRNSGGPAAYFQEHARYFPFLHLWSLSIEEQFYLIWPALMLALFRVRRLTAPAIALIFVASLVFCIVLTPINSTAAFYFLSARAWELALGALLAQREVFVEPAAPKAGVANLLAASGIFLMLLSVFWLLSETSPWPGSLALVPTIGCALVIAAPGARVSRVLLGNRPAQFFGQISYPLYLWHWPLLSYAHVLYGDDLSPWLTAGLLALAVLLAFLTWRLIERPVAAAYRRKPLAVAAPLLAGLALAGLVGSATRRADGFPGRFPPEVATMMDYRAGGAAGPQMACVESGSESRAGLDEWRRRASDFFAARQCAKIKDPAKPTIVVTGDSHALHLLAGLDRFYGDRANVLMFSSLWCAPLIAQSDWTTGMVGAPRCHAINQEVVRNILAIQPAAVVIGTYFEEFYDTESRYYPSFLKDFDANVAALRQGGFRGPIIVMGQVPTWSLWMPILVGREMLAGHGVSEFSSQNLKAESLETDARLQAHHWGENVFYLSQAGKLCGAQGCRRLVGPRLPEDVIANDYGHYTPAGSIFAVENILAPALDPILAKRP